MRVRSLVYVSEKVFALLFWGRWWLEIHCPYHLIFLMHHICQTVSEAPDRIDGSLPSARCSLFSVVCLCYYHGGCFCVLKERQQIRVSDVLLPVAHSALYVADIDLGISYHAFTVLSCGLCIPMSNTSSIDFISSEPTMCRPLVFGWVLFFPYWTSTSILLWLSGIYRLEKVITNIHMCVYNLCWTANKNFTLYLGYVDSNHQMSFLLTNKILGVVKTEEWATTLAVSCRCTSCQAAAWLLGVVGVPYCLAGQFQDRQGIPTSHGLMTSAAWLIIENQWT